MHQYGLRNKTINEENFLENSANKNQYEEECKKDDVLMNILSLKLKKPKNWKWELTTSRSCTNIAMPRILLYDDKDKLLVDTLNNQSDQIIKENTVKVKEKRRNSFKKISKAATCSFVDLCLAEDYIDHTPSTLRSPVHSLTPISADFQPSKYDVESKQSSFKEVRFNVNGKTNEQTNNSYSNGTSSTSNTHISTSNSSLGPREKRRYRHSKRTSDSILERLSLNKGRFSSPEFASEETLPAAPMYYLATSKAGTLVVQKESFSRYRRRRKKRNSSSENIQSSERSLDNINTKNDVQDKALIPERAAMISRKRVL